MRFQSTQASCGPASLRNALLARGIARSEEELATLAGCTPADGTPARGLLRALKAIAADHPDLKSGLISERRADIALLRLLDALRTGYVVIMCVDRDEHWVVAFGLLGQSTVHVADSADNELVKHYGPEALLERWRGLGRNPYYGIVV